MTDDAFYAIYARALEHALASRRLISGELLPAQCRINTEEAR